MNSFSLDGALSLDDHFLNGARPGRKHLHSSMSSLGLESEHRVQRLALEEWLKMVVERLGTALIRLKGVLRAARGEGEGEGEGSLVVQGVGGHIQVQEAEARCERSRLVVIGELTPELREELEKSFWCLFKAVSKA